MAPFFTNDFSCHDLLDIAPINLSPTWQNKRKGENRVTKRLDRFLIADILVLECDLVRQWVASGGNMITVLFSFRFREGVGNLLVLSNLILNG